MATFQEQVLARNQAKAAEQNLSGVIPYTESYSGSQYKGVLLDQKAPTEDKKAVQSESFLQKISNVGKQTAGIVKTGVEAGAQFVIDTPQAIYHGVQPFLQGIADVVTGNLTQDLGNISKQTAQLEDIQQQYMQAYQSGKMGKEQYIRLMEDLGKSFQDLSKQAQKIATKADRGNVVEGAVNTASTILSVGKLQLEAVSAQSAASVSLAARASALESGATTTRLLVKGVAGDASKAALNRLVSEQATAFEKIVMKLPTVRNLVLRNTQALAKLGVRQLVNESEDQFLLRAGRDIAVGLLLKRPLLYQLNIASAEDVYKDMTTGKYGSAAFAAGLQSLQLLEGPISGTLKAIKAGGSKLRELTYGNTSYVDNLSKRIGTGSFDQIANYVKSGAEVTSKSGRTTMSAEQVFRIAQENNLRLAQENVDSAVGNTLENYVHAGVDLSKMTPEKIAQDYLNWHEAAQLAKSTGQNVVAVRWDRFAKAKAATIMEKYGNDRAAVVNALFNSDTTANEAWNVNDNLKAQLIHIIDGAKDSAEMASRTRSIQTAVGHAENVSPAIQKQMSELGYILGTPTGGVRNSAYVDAEDTRKLISDVTGGVSEETRTIPNQVPSALQPLVKEAKAYNSVEEFVAAQKAKTVTTYKDVVKEVATTAGSTATKVGKTEVPTITASRTMKLGKPGVRGSSTALYNTLDPNLEQIMRSAIIAAKGTAKTAGEHADALYAAGFTDADIKAIRDFAVKSADADGNVAVDRLQTFVQGRLGSGASKAATTTTERVATTASANVNEADARKAYELAHAAPKTETITSDTSHLFDPATAPQPQLQAIGAFLTKIGLSPRASQQASFKALSRSVADKLDAVDVSEGLGFAGKVDAKGDRVLGGSVILSKLQAFVNNVEPSTALRTVTGTFGKARPAITDIRQMTIEEIQKALSSKAFRVTEEQAKSIRKAVLDGYLDVPMELRGAGDKLVDFAYKYNPAQKYYSRIQSALRYSYNPFFQAQEAFETAFFTGLQGENKASRLVKQQFNWGKAKAEIDSTIDTLDKAQVFGSKSAKEGLLSSSLAGEAAQDQVLGRLTADITRGQKRDLASLALDMAERQGVTVQHMIDNNPEQLADALRVIVQYPRKGVLASPLARTLNVAFFPMRYNAKVTMMAAQILAKQPPAVQFATIHSLLKMKDWMNSDEGIQWRARNADAIQVFNWLSPLGNIKSAFNTLGYAADRITGKQDGGIGQVGQLGGLPFGIISQVLDSEGIINLNAPYVNPKTGDVIPSYIPISTKAQAAVALQDLLGSMFTYPGRTLGLPGKQAFLRDSVDKFIKSGGGDYLPDYESDNLTPMQRNLIRVLNGDTGEEAIQALHTSPANDSFNWYTIPPSALPFNSPGGDTLANSKIAARSTKVKPRKGKTKAIAPGQF